MNKEELIKEIDNLILDSKMIIGSFVYHHCLDIYKPQLTKTKFEKLKQKYEEYKQVSFTENYQKWYSKALTIVECVMPERKSEFEKLYLPQNNRKELTLLNYTIFDAIRGIHSEAKRITVDSAFNLINTQIDIIKSVKEIVEHRLNEIKNLLEFDVFEKEIDSARYLLKNNYLRSAGAICGVIIEKHLANMLSMSGLKPLKKNPTINDYNDDLYQNKVINQTQFKYILYLGDIRNKCDHNKTSEPTKDEVEDLINGTEKVIKTY